MNGVRLLRPVWLAAIPAQLESGVIYISEQYKTAVHLCCCGCGKEVVTPLNRAKWRLTRIGEAVSLHPSIGNWSFPCQSHYWIERNTVRWAAPLNGKQVKKVQQRDAAAAFTWALGQEKGVHGTPSQASDISLWGRFWLWLNR